MAKKVNGKQAHMDEHVDNFPQAEKEPELNPDPLRHVKSSVELGETSAGELYVKSVKVPGENPDLAAEGALRAYRNVRAAIRRSNTHGDDMPTAEANLEWAKQVVAHAADQRSREGC